MITPADIEYKEFSRAVRGYKEEEVDAFLDLIIVDMEKLIKENKKLKEELEKAKGQVDKHISTETSVYETLDKLKVQFKILYSKVGDPYATRDLKDEVPPPHY